MNTCKRCGGSVKGQDVFNWEHRYRTDCVVFLIEQRNGLVMALRELVRVVDGTLQGYGIIEPSMAAAKVELAKLEPGAAA